MRLFFIIIVWFSLLITARSQELVHQGGSLTGNVRWSGNVIIHGDVIVERDARLTIAAGTRVLFEPDKDASRAGDDKTKCGLTIRGTLIAQGQMGRKIIFTSNSANPRMGDWEGLRFIKPKDLSILDYCVVEYATNGIIIKNSVVQISNSEIRYNFNSGLKIEVKAAPKIARSIISENDYAGIVCSLGAKPVLSDNLITLNNIGMVILSSSEPNLGYIGRGNQYNPGKNRILENEEFDIYNHSGKQIFAQNNIWNTESRNVIEEKIFHGQDDSRYGQITYQPIFKEEKEPQLTDFILLAQNTQETPVSQSVSQNNNTDVNENNQLNQNEEKELTTDSENDSTPAESVTSVSKNLAQVKIPENINSKFKETPVREIKTASEETRNQINYNNIFLEPFLDNKKKEWIHKENIQLTTAVKRAIQPGIVRIRVIVGKNGQVEEARILKGINETLNEASLEAAKKFVYRPGTVNGKNVRFSTMELFRFQ